MAKRFKNSSVFMVRFCMDCRRVYGCKDSATGANIKECSTCNDTKFCCAGIVIENLSKTIQNNATSGFCNNCRDYHLGLRKLSA